MREASFFMKQDTLKIWKLFSKRFRNANSCNVYFGDINEFLDYCKKDFLDITQIDADQFYHYLHEKVKQDLLRLTTVKKKIKELHKFSDFIIEIAQQELVKIPHTFDNFFYRYAVQYFAEEEIKKVPTLTEIDKLMDVAKNDIMTYTILAIVERIGLKSTDICNLKPNDIIRDGKESFLIIKRKKEREIRLIPEDVWIILEDYLNHRLHYEYLFYNKWGKKLNTQYFHLKMRTLTEQAGVPHYSLKDLRNVCGIVLFAYGVKPKQVAQQLGITTMHVGRYDKESYGKNMMKEVDKLVHLKIMPPDQKKIE